jgi:hypothetical protein
MESSPDEDVAVYHINHRVASSPRNAFTTGEETRAASNASRSVDPVSNTAPGDEEEGAVDDSIDARGARPDVPRAR